MGALYMLWRRKRCVMRNELSVADIDHCLSPLFEALADTQFSEDQFTSFAHRNPTSISAALGSKWVRLGARNTMLSES